MRVFVTRPEHEARRWVDELCQRGFDAQAFPLIAILPVADAAPVQDAWRRLAACRAAMFVSGNAVRHFFGSRPAGMAWPPAARAWATGAGTHAALIAAGVPGASIDAPPASAVQFDSETLWSQVAPQVRTGDRVLIVRGGDAQGAAAGRDWLAERLGSVGAVVDTVVSYRRGAPQLTAAQLALARAGGVWLFSSSEAIAHLTELLPQQDWRGSRAVATHPRIAHAARRAGFGVVCESRPAVDAVVAVLESFR
ncbi:uroporphyrinogen-III synthase [Ramlibacter sp.]|uniref:uroporphyrinogen-III synthase n=1 Tax=Ramlibacter sp. TaxID=1917967 RepID=UPI002C84A9F6|nr:uroporphyrinogen-III synthase [Ramlibacter sp.]HWI81586.1 uroporphyrinogen-III synthase [Ramlibacter sp.]